MNLQSSHNSLPQPYPGAGMMVPLPALSGIESVVLRHLKTREQIESVLHLREEIDLSVHSSASSNFASLEKKETSWGSSSHSS